jgi:alkanesulfonate monooxygenase SsuD/methylene tetrahydromethanopterin reductase-like flavin-dependent oxidoreductase (luciferase family)
MGERFDRLEEGIAVIRALWQGGPVDFDGRYYRLQAAAAYPRPVQQPAPPLLVGGDGEVRLLGIVARHADEWNSHAPGPDTYRAKRSRLEAHCREAGRDVDQIKRSWMGGIVIGRDDAEVRERAGWFHGFLPAIGRVPSDQVLSELRRRHWLVGIPDQIEEQLREWSAAGVQRMMLQWYNLDDLAGLQLLAQLHEP